jgi:hypothetical protein
LFSAWQERFRAPEIHHQISFSLHTRHHAVDQLTLTIDKLIEDRLALGLADLLNNHLLGSLRRNATVIFKLVNHIDGLPEVRSRRNRLRFL